MKAARQVSVVSGLPGLLASLCKEIVQAMYLACLAPKERNHQYERNQKIVVALDGDASIIGIVIKRPV